MFKRVRWVGMGYAAGLGTSVYVARRVRQTMARYTTPELRDRVATGVGNASGRIADAIAEGREAMQVRERELHEALRAGREIAPGVVNGRPAQSRRH